MQPDPVYKNMVKKSFILQKYNDIQVPLVKKQPNIQHHTFTTLILSTAIHLLIYPLDTIKTRIVSKNKIIDVAKFQSNRVTQLPSTLGIVRGYGSLVIGNICHLALGKQSLLLAATAQGLMKTWVDMSKISKQMGNKQGDFQIMKKSFGICAFYGIFRDVLFRTLYVKISSFLHQRYLMNSKFYDERVRINNVFFSVLVATIISQPFQVCFIKAASQRSFKYDKVLELPRKIMKEEGMGKLFLSGLWPRIAYNMLSTIILLNSYDKLLEISLQVF